MHTTLCSVSQVKSYHTDDTTGKVQSHNTLQEVSLSCLLYITGKVQSHTLQEVLPSCLWYITGKVQSQTHSRKWRTSVCSVPQMERYIVVYSVSQVLAFE